MKKLHWMAVFMLVCVPLAAQAGTFREAATASASHPSSEGFTTRLTRTRQPAVALKSIVAGKIAAERQTKRCKANGLSPYGDCSQGCQAAVNCADKACAGQNCVEYGTR